MTNSLTYQEALDISTRGIIAQGGPSYLYSGKDIVCRYRGNNGCKCAIGQLIPDNKYFPAMDSGTEIEGPMFALSVLQAAKVISEDEDSFFWTALQLAHDSACGYLKDGHVMLRSLNEFWIDWRHRLKLLAQGYDLNPVVINEIPIGQGAPSA